jgi:hypothetical protein
MVWGAYYGMDRDRWVEILRCPICRKTGEAQLSAADEDWLITRVESAPGGFKVIQLRMASTFFAPRAASSWNHRALAAAPQSNGPSSGAS